MVGVYCQSNDPGVKDSVVNRFPGVAAVAALEDSTVSRGINRGWCPRVCQHYVGGHAKAAVARFPGLAAIARAVKNRDGGAGLKCVLGGKVRRISDAGEVDI